MHATSSGARHRASIGELVRTLPARQLFLLWLAVFSTFASLAFMFDIMAGGRFPLAWLLLTALASGLFSVGFTATSIGRRWNAVAMLVAADVVYIFVVRRVFHFEASAPAGRLVLDALGAMATISIGYTLFILFMNVTATRYLRAQAELAVAHEIHRVLVPHIDCAIGEFEFYGWSFASGEVGGDLVDVVQTNGHWLGYIADVSGHGVGAGMVMGVFKGALRTRAAAAGPMGAILGDVQRALMPLKRPNMFVTLACVRGSSGPEIECAVAGHHPILRVRAGRVDEVTTQQLAIGMFAEAQFTSTRVECQKGDLLALLTDGLIEVFDATDRELGLDWAKTQLAAAGTRPLRDIADRLLAGVRAHGPQIDDQTILLIRRGASGAPVSK